jgi:micrococcal nuclease
VTYVYDGDTLELDDGTRVRLVGINTPELGRNDDPDEPFATQARERLLRMVQESGQRIRMQPAAERQDRYGRVLAHTYSPTGASLQERLLGAGLALVHIHPPNLGNLECYREAEARARSSLLGIWRDWPIAASEIHRRHERFVLLRGRVKGVKHNRRSVRVELENGPSLRIARDDLGHFGALDPDSLEGKSIEARGWLHRYRGRLGMRIRHPAALSILQ